jgi:recombinational DNA repair protein RecR
MKNLKSLERLIESLSKLPRVGKKSAERMAFAILDMDDDDFEENYEKMRMLNRF